MKSIIDKKRQTGRTTRMMQYAVEEAKAGKAVYIVFSTIHECERLSRDIDHSLGIKFETRASLGRNSLDFRHMQITGAHPNVLLLVDHHVLEQEFSRVLEMWSQFDE